MNKYYFLIIILKITISATSQEYIYIKGNKFSMGNTSHYDNKKHKVKIDDFYICSTEVTNEQFVTFLNEVGNNFHNEIIWLDYSWKWRQQKCPIVFEDSIYKVIEGFQNYPVVNVTWYGAMAYCNYKGGRLPTEAEWEYVAQLIFKEIYDKNINDYAVFRTDTQYIFQPVKSKKSVLGIYDFFGNAEEWCLDWYNKQYYKKSKINNPLGPTNGDQKVKRGGNWSDFSNKFSLYTRKVANPNTHNITTGFRVVIPIKK